MIDSVPRFLQGIFPFLGRGLGEPVPLGDKVSYVVPADRRSQLVYLRAGNSADELVTLVLMRNGKPFRYFPIAAKGTAHVTLAVVEDLPPETKLEVLLAAPSGVSGTLVLDVGLIEVL